MAEENKGAPKMGEVTGGNQEAEAEAEAAAMEQLQKLLSTPLSREGAEQVFADIDVRRAELMVIRQKWSTELTQKQLELAALDEQLYALELDKAVAFKRTLIKKPEEAK